MAYNFCESCKKEQIASLVTKNKCIYCKAKEERLKPKQPINIVKEVIEQPIEESKIEQPIEQPINEQSRIEKQIEELKRKIKFLESE